MFGLTSSTEELYVVDNTVNFSNQEALYEFCKNSTFRLGHSASSIHPQDLSRFASYLTPEELSLTKLDNLFSALIKDKYKQDVKIERSYINVYFPYTPTATHTDNCAEGAITFLYYANPTWQVDWAGETQFFTDDLQDIKKSVLPKGGRAVLFNSSIPHIARAPSVLCPVPRFTLTIKGMLV
jgi:Rps23 Pro-64 3,4-dihydroxylase Tpa1-like proline 4-hydroxylase